MKTFRRQLLDECLDRHKALITGRVLDIGGKKRNKRGSFEPVLDHVKRWQYLNIDDSTGPDFCCNADNIPLEDHSVDTVILTEVLEYLPNPRKVFREVERILSKDGHIFVSSPFLVPIHGDYWADRARYTPVMIEEIVESSGLEISLIEPMGSVGTIIFDLLHVATGYAAKNSRSVRPLRLILHVRWLFRLLDNCFSYQKEYLNSGYFIVLRKKAPR